MSRHDNKELDNLLRNTNRVINQLKAGKTIDDVPDTDKKSLPTAVLNSIATAEMLSVLDDHELRMALNTLVDLKGELALRNLIECIACFGTKGSEDEDWKIPVIGSFIVGALYVCKYEDKFKLPRGPFDQLFADFIIVLNKIKKAINHGN